MDAQTQGERRVGVPEALGDDAHVYALAQQQVGGVGVPQVVESQPQQTLAPAEARPHARKATPRHVSRGIDRTAVSAVATSARRQANDVLWVFHPVLWPRMLIR
jgi:hypothetical protein